jgi:hypothetical protein
MNWYSPNLTLTQQRQCSIISFIMKIVTEPEGEYSEAATFDAVLTTRRYIRDAMATHGIEGAMRLEVEAILAPQLDQAARALGVDQQAVLVAEAALAEYERGNS